ncbi:MAG: hypothetical protein PVG07_12425, partial [Acidobacteriota bacterium]
SHGGLGGRPPHPEVRARPPDHAPVERPETLGRPHLQDHRVHWPRGCLWIGRWAGRCSGLSPGCAGERRGERRDGQAREPHGYRDR